MEIPKQLKKLKFCRIRKQSKAPFEKDWTNKHYSYEEITPLFPMENYGVLCGQKDLAVIDCDKDELSLMVSQLLPKTFSVRTGGGGMHFYYFVPELKKKIILNLDEEHLGEIQSHGTQVVGAGSTHPNGNLYEVIDNVGIKTISLVEVEKYLGKFMKKEEDITKKKKETGELTKEIASQIDFEKLLLGYGLEKKGDNWNCPFHKSEGGQCLSVDKEKGIFNCFHCKRSGNIISFISEVEGVTIVEAIKKIKKMNEVEGEDPKLKRIISSYINKEDLTKQILKVQPLFYDKSKMWWMWENNKFKWKLIDETDILNLVNRLSFANTINSKEKSEIIEALKQGSRLNKPKDIKPTWIQFKDLIIDIETGEEFKATSKYFATNPIPWSLNKERFIKTPIMNRIFEEWVGKDYVQTLYEILAYCLLPDYPIHRLFCFIGEGLNGKSCFLRLLTNFIGEDNVTSTELDTLLTSRFEITRLHKKLACQMGETNFSEINKTSIIKKLTGQDIIGFEYKNKNPFDSFNYAKVLIATNNLPTTTDKTVGFYRRWLIIDFPNKFSEEKDILKDIPKEEYEILAVKSLIILKELIDKRKFHKEGTIEEREKKYEEKSDPLEKFMKEFTDDTDPEGSIPKWEFEKTLNEWLKENRFRSMVDRTITKRMKENNIEDGRVYVKWFEGNFETKKQVRAWLGVKWKEKQKNDK